MIKNPKRGDRVVVRREGEEPFKGEVDRVEWPEALVVIQDERGGRGNLILRRVKMADCRRLVKRKAAA